MNGAGETGAFADKRRSFRQPQWHGDMPFAGKTILLHAEQGFGDTLQFIRYAPLLASRGARVICEVQPELVSLLSHSKASGSSPKGNALPNFDLHCPFLSLPFAFGTEPCDHPGASTLSCRARSARSAIGAIGWAKALRASASSGPARRRTRTMPIARSRWRVSAGCLRTRRLRASACNARCATPTARPCRGCQNLVDLGPELADFADTAAVISLLDLVVSVDTSVAHLAGALGKPVVILLPHAADFRWLRERSDTPWYRSAKLLRQPAFGDWDSVIDGLADELSGRARDGDSH